MPRRITQPPVRPLPAPPARLDGSAKATLTLEQMLTAATTLPRGAGAEGSEPLLNRRETARVRQALASASPATKKELLGLAATLKGPGAPVAQGLLLRAVAARAGRLDTPTSLEPLRQLTETMRGLDASTLRERATVLDLDSSKDTNRFDAQTLWEKRGVVQARPGRAAADDDGLLQRFTSTCGPTTLQMLLAEADPVVAFAITGGGKASLSTTDDAAKFQKAVLEEFGGVGIPRHESNLAARISNGLGRLVAARQLPTAAKDALLQHLKGQGPLDAGSTAALAALRTKQGGFPSDAEVALVRAATIPARDSGLGTAEFHQALEKYAEQVTGVPLKMTSPADGFARGGAKKHLDAVAKALSAGVDVPFGVVQPDHWMLLTNVRTVAGGREFLVSDPDAGRTAWVKEKDLASGAFGDTQFNLSMPGERPYIDSFFLPR